MFLVTTTFIMWYWIIVGIIALAVALIHAGIENMGAFDLEDFFDAFFGELGWLFTLIVLALGGIVFAFIAWIWWAMLLIILGIFAIAGIIALCVHLYNEHELKEYMAWKAANPEEAAKLEAGYEQDDEEEIDYDDIDPEYDDVEDYVTDPKALSIFPLKRLKEYCEDNDFEGYKGLTKVELIELIIKYNNPGDYANALEEEPEKEVEKLVVKPNDKGIRFKDIAGLNEAKEAFKEKVILPFEHPEIFEKFGKKAGGGILLYGLPGTGKTMFAEATSNELDALFISVKCSDIKSKWYGESEQKVKEIFDKARKAKRAIIFFDEFEAIGAKRTDNSENGNNDLVPEILAEMQGVGTNNNDCTIMVIAATNKPWAIDSAFLRPGRFDEKIYIPLPDYESRKKLFELQLAKLPVADDLDYDYLAKITEGFNGADIKEVCEKLKMSAIKDSLSKGSEQTIGMDDVKRIESSIRSSVSQEDIERLEEFENK